MQTPEQIKARQRLRWHPQIRQAAKRLWLVAKLDKGGMCREEYLNFHLSTYRYLLMEQGGDSADDDDFDEEDARETGLDDWATDVPPGFQTLSCDAFLDAIFQLADLHVETIRPRDYQKFIHDLYRGTVQRNEDGSLGWRHCWPSAEGAGASSSPNAERCHSTKMKLRSGWKILGMVSVATVAPA